MPTWRHCGRTHGRFATNHPSCPKGSGNKGGYSQEQPPPNASPAPARLEGDGIRHPIIAPARRSAGAYVDFLALKRGGVFSPSVELNHPATRAAIHAASAALRVDL
jgi:hypothetical protein